MGQATDRKLTEIEETRRRLEADLRELEARVPAPIRSVKSLVGVAIGSTVLMAVVLRMLRAKRANGDRHEVVIRVVHDDGGRPPHAGPQSGGTKRRGSNGAGS